MPIYFFSDVIFKGLDAVPSSAIPILKALPWVALTWLLKWYFGGVKNTAERLMHSKVIMMTVHLRSSRFTKGRLTWIRVVRLV